MTLPTDSPNAPEEVRQPRKAGPPRWLIIIGGAILFLLVAGWWSQRPLARIPLPDGGELLLVEAHYASTYHLSSIGFRERLRHLLPDQWGTPLDDDDGEDFGGENEPPQLWLVFKPHAAGKKDPNASETLRVGAMESGVLLEQLDSATETNAARFVIGLSLYPRRARQLDLCLVVQKEQQPGRIVYATIPNPFPVTDAPRWTPEPLPQTRKLKSREVVLESLGLVSHDTSDPAVPTAISCAAEIKVHEPGIPDDAFETMFDFADATGNQGGDLLPLSEPAWKVRATVWANDKYPFPAANILSLGHVTMPGPGEYRILPLLPDSTGIARQAILAGTGWYHAHLGDELTVESIPRPMPRAPAMTTPPAGASKDQNFECVHPELIVLGWGTPTYQPPPDGFRQMWRVVIGTYIIPLHNYHAEGASYDSWRQGYPISYHGEDVPAGMDVETQSILSPMENVDFFVQPPQR